MSGKIGNGIVNYSHELITSDPVFSGGGVENAFDGNTHTSWKPNSSDAYAHIDIIGIVPTIANFMAISGAENIEDLHRVEFYGANNTDFTDKVEIFTIAMIDQNGGVLIEFSTNTVEYLHYRITMVNNTRPVNQAEFSNILIGEALDLPQGVSAPYTPPKLSAKTEILNNKTMGGHFVGRSVLSGQYDFIIKNKNVSPEWIEENWLDLHKQISEKPFMYLWDDTRQQDAVFCWTKGDIPPPKYDNQCYFSFSIPCNGFIEND